MVKDGNLNVIDAFLSNSVFNEAMLDMQSIGLTVSRSPSEGAIKYAVIGGRSNSRWWLIPLTNHKVTYSGFALFQPLVTSAKILKTIVLFLTQVGLSGLWVRNKIYISGHSVLEQYFPHSKQLSYAYFTGTDSPHRKLAVQMMDDQGNIKGYAKVSRNPQVQALLKHETEMLHYVKTLNLKTAHTPNIVFSGQHQQAYVLVTDTLKTPKTKSVTKLTQLHVDFLRELANKTQTVDHNNLDWIVEYLRSWFKKLEPRLTLEWKVRLDKAITAIKQHKEHILQPLMTHGDFTPWNTFVSDGKLYVFDWEYANNKSSIGYDAIHFLLASLEMQKHTIQKQIVNVLNRLCMFLSINREDASIHFMVYLCIHTMQYVQRVVNTGEVLHEWDRQQQSAQLIDALLVCDNK